MRKLSVERAKEERVKNKWILLKGKKKRLHSISSITIKEKVKEKVKEKGEPTSKNDKKTFKVVEVEKSRPAFKLEFTSGTPVNIDPNTIIEFVSVNYNEELSNMEEYILYMNPSKKPIKVNFKTANLIKDMDSYKILNDPGYKEYKVDSNEYRPLIYFGHIGSVACYIDIALGNRDNSYYINRQRIPLIKFNYIFDDLA